MVEGRSAGVKRGECGNVTAHLWTHLGQAHGLLRDGMDLEFNPQ